MLLQSRYIGYIGPILLIVLFVDIPLAVAAGSVTRGDSSVAVAPAEELVTLYLTLLQYIMTHSAYIYPLDCVVLI